VHAFDLGRACSLAVLLAAACGGKGSTSAGSTGGEAGQPGQAGASAQGGSAGSAGSAASSGAAGLEHDPAADALPCVNHPRRPPCEVIDDRPVPGPRPICPEAEPVVGETCAEPGLVCGYGDAATPTCRHYYECTETGWRLDPRINEDRYACEEQPEEFCPAEPPPLGLACTPTGAWAPCVYEDAMCSCMIGDHWASGSERWLCYGPPRDADCPKSLPNIGEGCATQGVQCSYLEGCDFPPYSTVFCRNGAWEEGERSTPCLL